VAILSPVKSTLEPVSFGLILLSEDFVDGDVGNLVEKAVRGLGFRGFGLRLRPALRQAEGEARVLAGVGGLEEGHQAPA